MKHGSVTPAEQRDAVVALASRIANGSPEPQAPRTIRWQEVATIPEVFQQRHIDVDTSGGHVQTLARAIQRTGRGARQAALEPVSVFWVGDAWACVDGHHRLVAYQRVEHVAAIPVKALKGATLTEAIQASLGKNSQDKLPLSKRCKTEAAWRLTLAGGLSKAAIQRLADVDASTVAAMRTAVRTFRAGNPTGDPAGLTWAQMRHWKRPLAEGTEKDATLRRAEQLIRLAGRHLKDASPETLLVALDLVTPGLVLQLVRLHHDRLQHSTSHGVDPFPWIASSTEDNPDF